MSYDLGLDVLAHGGGHRRGGGSRAPRGYGGLYSDDLDDYVDDDGIIVERIEVLGMIDIGSAQKQMNTIGQVTAGIAQLLLKGGQTAINGARTTASAKNLPGGTARDNVYWKLQWHQSALAPLAGTPNAIYGSGDDLKHWVMQAFIEANAVEEGAAYLDAAWTQMWNDIKIAIAALPAAVAKVVTEGAEGLETTTKWIIGGVCVAAGVLLFAIYKTINGPLGKHVATHVADRYLP